MRIEAHFRTIAYDIIVNNLIGFAQNKAHRSPNRESDPGQGVCNPGVAQGLLDNGFPSFWEKLSDAKQSVRRGYAQEKLRPVRVLSGQKWCRCLELLHKENRERYHQTLHTLKSSLFRNLVLSAKQSGHEKLSVYKHNRLHDTKGR